MKILKTHLNQQGILLYDFAKRLGITQDHLSFIIHNKRTPSLKLLRKIHQATKIPYEKLIEEE